MLRNSTASLGNEHTQGQETNADRATKQGLSRETHADRVSNEHHAKVAKRMWPGSQKSQLSLIQHFSFATELHISPSAKISSHRVFTRDAVGTETPRLEPPQGRGAPETSL